MKKIHFENNLLKEKKTIIKKIKILKTKKKTLY